VGVFDSPFDSPVRVGVFDSGNKEENFRGTKLSNDTHESTTAPDARLFFGRGAIRLITSVETGRIILLQAETSLRKQPDKCDLSG
jgi:hypothetical protein